MKHHQIKNKLSGILPVSFEVEDAFKSLTGIDVLDSITPLSDTEYDRFYWFKKGYIARTEEN